MHTTQVLSEVLAAAERRRHERRAFLRTAGAAAATAGVAGLLAGCKDDHNNDYPATPFPTPAPTPSDADVLNFALNLEYLEAQFYAYAATGAGLPSSQLGGTGTQGTVTGGRRVNFSDPVVAQYAREIAADEAAHVAFLRTALGSSAVAMPSINIDGGASGAFTAAARAAGVVGASGTFDPYASDENFLLGAFIFEDVGVTAYKGASPLVTNKTYLEAAAGILAAEAYHAGLVRTVLYAKGLATPSLRTIAGQISDARDSLDGTTDLDQGIVGSDSTVSNIVPADANGIAFSRTPGQVLNIVYLSASATTSGGFFPSGVNGTVRTSSGV
ncbi:MULTISPECIES: ferritin-like domain-containing protein [unclassified Sphingomonas]|uniref:ferritin-like domain-containing protein n=1 Tax=unclassified Sphingomonas TaxID=196159 RepID=UPI000E1056F9|nr:MULTISPECIES: ferritin-like domain-containing protein [unclassified Sphingomonas]AXJ96867.1 ferritin-like domain-containing protein [Sphingomonas sp. FARSPH]